MASTARWRVSCITLPVNADLLLPGCLVAQGVIGGVDTLLNHELLEDLPHRPEARREIGIHALRECNYALIFAGLGWLEWHGALAWLPLALVIAEVLVTGWDEWVENLTRVMPQNERVLHVLLTLNLGILATLLAAKLPGWLELPTGLLPTEPSLSRKALTLLSVLALAWAVRDALAWRRLGSGR